MKGTSMYAVFQMSGFQFNAEEGARVRIPHQNLKTGDKLDISDILLVKDEDKVLIGTPFVEGAKIEAEVVEAGKDEKVTVYKYKKRTKYRLTRGHRQDYTDVKINKIIAPGE
jgi:large subunit ribosomal protein L21